MNPLAVAMFSLVLAGCGKDVPDEERAVSSGNPGNGVPLAATTASAGADSSRMDIESVEDFLQRHWDRPLPPQGRPPARFSPLESSLDAESCATCHPAQAEDWKQSLHSRAMGPGVLGQLLNMPPGARDEHQSCLRCHAPLAEQADALVAEIEGRTVPTGKGPMPLHRQGLTCAACHVRAHERHGPPRRDGSAPNPGEVLPHGGWKATKAFEDSRFCAACHQFEPDDYAINGKLLEDTWAEWRASRYAKEGKTCQSCHMPDRRHLWKGIHDPETTGRGVTIEPFVWQSDGDLLKARLSVANTGTGHRFPTYVTPQVVLEGIQVTASGEPLAGTEDYFVIGRRVTLDLAEEVFDTRLAPGERAELNYEQPRHPEASRLILRVWVEPDAFYEGFYRSLLESGAADGPGQELIREALEQSQGSVYTLHETEIPLDQVP